MLSEGRIKGGDSNLYYTGHYTFRNGKWRGEMIVNHHIEAVGKPLAFGGREVTCGFSWDYSAGGASRGHGARRQDQRDVHRAVDAEASDISTS